MAREPIPTFCFALVVVRDGDRFLVVHEQKHGQRWYLPAGGLEPGESFAHAAQRESLEEAGIPIELTGILRIEHSPVAASARMRVIFLARPIDDTPPKSLADAESLAARWVTLDELSGLPLRGDEVAELFGAVLAGAPVYPLSLLQVEGKPLVDR
jgi:8-oxo-dGTP pyrophosphatase MutT (NUDIX family)